MAKSKGSNPKIQIDSGVNTSGVDAGLKKIEAGVDAMASKVQAAGKKAGAGMDAVGASADGAAKKAERATNDLTRSIERYIARQKTAEQGTAAYFEEIAKQRGANVEALRPLIDEARRVEEAHKKAQGSMENMGLTAKQTRLALQQVPAQLTDIVVSLQGGQAPLTVLLQQGGQLKDVFGGVGAAVRGLGGFLLTLITPMTVLGAAAATVLYGFTAGRKENEEYVRSLALTGNQAGTTASQLAGMAAALDNNAGTTQARAAEVLAALVSTGAVAGAQLQRVAAAAIELDRVGGPAVEDTVKQFAALAKDPLSAALRLNEATGFLTASVYEQIRALSEQGKSTEAARVAQEAYAQAIEQRAPEIAANIGLIEEAWKGVKQLGAEVLDTLKGIGRIGSIDAQIADLQAAVDRWERLGKGSGGLLGLFGSDRAAQLREQIELLRQAQETERRRAEEQQKQAKAVETKAQFDKDGLAYLTDRVRNERELARVQEQTQRLVAAGVLDEAEARQRLAYIRAQYESPLAIEQVKAAEARRAEALKQQLDTLNLLRATGYVTEFEFLRRNADLAQQGIDNRIRATQQELAIARTRHDGARDVAKLETELAQLVAQRETERRAGIYATTEALEKQRRAVEAVMLAWRQEQQDEINQSLVAQSKARERVALSLYEFNRGIREEAELLSLEQSLIGATSRVRETRLAQYRIELDLKRRIAEIDATVYEGGEVEREEKRAEARAAAQRAMLNASQRIMLDEWRETTNEMADLLAGAIEDGFRDGSSFSKAFRDKFVGYMREAFTGELRRALQWVMSPGATGGGAGGASGSTLSSLASLYGRSGGAGGLADYYSAFSGSSYGTNWGSEQSRMLADQEAGMGGSSSAAGGAAAMGSAASLWVAFAAIVAQKAGDDYNRGFRREQAKNYQREWGDWSAALPGFGGFESEVSKRLEKWGMNRKWADILSGSTAVAKLLGYGAPQVTDSAIVGSIGGGDVEGQRYTQITERVGTVRRYLGGRDRKTDVFEALGADLEGLLDKGAAETLQGVEEWARVLRLPADQLSNIRRDLRVTFTGDAEKDKAALEKVFADYQEALAANFSELLTPFREFGETAAQTLARLAGLQTFSEQINLLGGVFGDVASLSFDARQSLVDFAGGIEEFKAKAQDFIQNYYSRDEIAGVKARDIVSVLGQVGIGTDMLAGLDTRDEFRQLLESRDVTTEEGRQQLAALLNIQGSFAELADYLAETGGTLVSTVGQAPDSAVLDGGAAASTSQQVSAIFDVRDSVDEVARLLQRLIDVTVAPPQPAAAPAPPPPAFDFPTEVTGGA